MAAQFTSDSQMMAAQNTLTASGESNGPLSLALRVPYQNGKIRVSGTILVQSGTGTTGIQLRVRRNINNENVVLNPAVQTLPLAASTIGAFPFDFTDSVPDGRDCQYQVTVAQIAGTGAGNILSGSTINCVVLSG